LRSAEAALAGDEHVTVAHRAHQDWLQHALRADRFGKFLECGVVELQARLLGIRGHAVERDFAHEIASSGEVSGELRVGVMQTSLSGLFAGILIPFTRTYPRIDVRIVRDTSAGLYPKLLSGEIDAAITSQPPFAIPKTCEWHVLREEPFVVLTPASLKARNAHEVLAQEPFIRLDRKVFAGRLIDDYLRKVGIRPKDRYELDGLELIAVMVDRGLGVSLLPDWAPPWPEGLSLRKLALPERSLVRRTGLLWNRASLRARLVRAFLEQAQFAIGRGRGTPGGRKRKTRT